MSFPISPGVYSVEKDYTNAVPTLATSTAALAGIFSWGPLFVPYFIGSQKKYNLTFGPCTANNFETYMTGYNFLEYGQSLFVVRTANTTATSGTGPADNAAVNAVGGLAPTGNDVLASVVLNTAEFHSRLTDYPSTVNYVAKYPGTKGNSLLVTQCDSAAQYHSNVAISGVIAGNGASAGNTYIGTLNLVPGSNVGTLLFVASGTSSIPVGNLFANTVVLDFAVGDVIKANTGIRGTPYQYLHTTAIGNAVTNAVSTSVKVNFDKPYVGGANVAVTGSVERFWQFYKVVTPPSSWVSPDQKSSTNPTVADLMQVVVVDENGAFSGVSNSVLEVYNNVSRATNAVNSDGTSNYYKQVINTKSPYVWNVNDRLGSTSDTRANLVAVTSGSTPLTVSLAGGQDGDSESAAPMQTLINGWTLFQGVDDITIDFVLAGKSIGSTAPAGEVPITYNNFGMASWLISNIGQHRRDCVVFFSPDRDVVLNNAGMEAEDLINWASLLPSSTYAFMDNNYKYQYDAQNNVYRWVPFNGDVAGLCAYTDSIAYPWVSPGGFTRGIISNVTQVAFNAQEPDRDLIYPVGINPIVSFPGKGTVLYGDRTFTGQDTGFNRLNVRRLFLVVERAVKAYAQYTLFELNDVFTQNQFKNMITPYLRGIVGANGMSAFLVDCDGTVNTPQVQDNEEFLCSIFIKPMHSINFIQITYVNTPTGTAFSTLENVSIA